MGSNLPHQGITDSGNYAKEFMGKDPFVTYLGDNPLKNGIRVIHKMMVDEKADCVMSLMPMSECRTKQKAETAACDGLSTRLRLFNGVDCTWNSVYARGIR